MGGWIQATPSSDESCAVVSVASGGPNSEVLRGAPVSKPATRDEIVAALHEADGYLSLVGYRKRDVLGASLASEVIAASTICRSLVKRIEEHGIKHGRTLTAEDWSA